MGEEMQFRPLARFFIVISPSQIMKEEIENGVWIMDGCRFYIKRWEAGFDPYRHNMEKYKIGSNF